MSRKQFIIKGLQNVDCIACLYGLNGLMDSAFGYECEINRAAWIEDHSLLQSALKLASRFLCTAAVHLIYHISKDMVELRDSGKDISSMVNQIRFLMRYL